MEKTYVMIKPDAIMRGLAGEIISRFERRGLKIVALKMMQLSEDLLRVHYAHHSDKPFFPDLLEFMQSGPVIAMVVEGKNAVRLVRHIVGATNPLEASPGTIRGDFAAAVQNNLVHASDSLETAEAEIKRFFDGEKLFEYKKPDEEWVVGR